MVSTEVKSGGAARAMVRSAVALSELGHVVYLITLASNDCEDRLVVNIVEEGSSSGAIRAHEFYNSLYLNRFNRTDQSNTLFWVPSVGFDISAVIRELDVDVVNIHWVSYFLSIKSLESIFETGLPVVFTLHDMAMLTGGCHYSAGCRGFEGDCGTCPQLRFDPIRLPKRVMQHKKGLFKRYKPWAISPSPWLAEQARLSGLFCDGRIRPVSNALDTQVYSPKGRDSQRKAWGLGNDDVAILFGAFENSEHRKGFDLMVAAISRLVESWKTEKADLRINVIVFGHNSPEAKVPGARVVNVGYIEDDQELADVYAGCDVVALPSREDNQPNVMMEGFACGVPVVGFRTGGVADYVNDCNGMLAEPFDIEDFARCLDSTLTRVLASPDWRQEIAKETSKVVDEFTHAMECLKLFQAALAGTCGTGKSYEIYRASPINEAGVMRTAGSLVEWF